MALASTLQGRGHQTAIATHPVYRSKIEQAGIGFRPLRPDYDPTDRKGNLHAMDPWRGTEFILREGLFPYLGETYDDLRLALEGFDLLISHMIVFPAPLLAEQTGIPWVNVVLAPISLFSDYEEAYAMPIPSMNRFMNSRDWIWRLFSWAVKKGSEKWCDPIRQLRRSVGLPTGLHPLFAGQHSPSLGLALFSRVFGAPQPDWPPQLRQAGFLFYDTETTLPDDLQRFLDKGEPPIVFTLGTAAVINPGQFFYQSLEAAKQLGRRAVILAGPNQNFPSRPDVLITRYAPFSELLLRAAALVHQGGIGTTAQALRAGCPALVVPFAHDQPDNAARVVRLQAGRSITLRKYNAHTAASELDMLLSDATYRKGAEAAAREIRTENAPEAACTLVENLNS